MKTKSRYWAILSTLTILTFVTGCGTHSLSSQTNRSTVANPTSGTANVAYAGSLQLVNDQFIGPAFTKVTGIPYEGRGGGALGVAHLIANNEISPNVFESIGTAPLEQMGAKTPKWAIGFASSPLVIAYSPNSPFASKLQEIADGQKPLRNLFTLMEQPGFHLGRTNPATDPQGQAFILMLKLAEKEFHLPSGTVQKIIGSYTNPKQLFAEEAILSRLQAGQLDATSAYLPEAIQHHLPFIRLPATINMGDPSDKTVYASVHMNINGKTIQGKPIEIYITTVPGNPDQKAGEKFISFLLSKQGIKIYKKNGYSITPFQIWGNKQDIPASIHSEIQG